MVAAERYVARGRPQPGAVIIQERLAHGHRLWRGGRGTYATRVRHRPERGRPRVAGIGRAPALFVQRTRCGRPQERRRQTTATAAVTIAAATAAIAAAG